MFKNTYIGWMAKDIKDGVDKDMRMNPDKGRLDTTIFDEKPVLLENGLWDGEASHTDWFENQFIIWLDQFEIAPGECKKVKITIEEIK